MPRRCASACWWSVVARTQPLPAPPAPHACAARYQAPPTLRHANHLDDEVFLGAAQRMVQSARPSAVRPCDAAPPQSCRAVPDPERSRAEPPRERAADREKYTHRDLDRESGTTQE